jgi:hypothetical protein
MPSVITSAVEGICVGVRARDSAVRYDTLADFDLCVPAVLVVQLMQVAAVRSAATGRLFVGWPNYRLGLRRRGGGPASAGVCGARCEPGRGQR